MLLSSQKLRARAQHCRKLAAVMRDNIMRSQMLDIAEQYDRLAGQQPRADRVAKRRGRSRP